MRVFQTPPNWPTPPAGWTPPPGWRPKTYWGPAPPGWQFWVDIVPLQTMEPKTPKRVAAWVGFALAVVAGIALGVVYAGLRHHPQPPINVGGTVTLNNPRAYVISGAYCTGTGSYSSLTPGTPVTITDGHGSALATALLGQGQLTDDGACSFSFGAQVTGGYQTYTVSIADHSVVESAERLTTIVIAMDR